jgi:hypothetical protein
MLGMYMIFKTRAQSHKLENIISCQLKPPISTSKRLIDSCGLIISMQAACAAEVSRQLHNSLTAANNFSGLLKTAG